MHLTTSHIIFEIRLCVCNLVVGKILKMSHNKMCEVYHFCGGIINIYTRTHVIDDAISYVKRVNVIFRKIYRRWRRRRRSRKCNIICSIFSYTVCVKLKFAARDRANVTHVNYHATYTCTYVYKFNGRYIQIHTGSLAI